MMMMMMLHSPDVKAKRSWHAPQLHCVKSHLSFSEKVNTVYSFNYDTKQGGGVICVLHHEDVKRSFYVPLYTRQKYSPSTAQGKWGWGVGCMFLPDPLDGELNEEDRALWLTNGPKTCSAPS